MKKLQIEYLEILETFLDQKNKVKQIRNPFGSEEEKNCYKPVRASIFSSNNYIEYESNREKNKTLSVEEYLSKTRPYSKHIINNLKKSDTWKIQLTMANNFISSIDNDEELVMRIKSYNIEIIINDEVDEYIKELFDSLKNSHQNNLKSMKGTEFVFDYVYLLYCKCHKIKTTRGRSYIDSPDQIKNKKAAINSIDKKYNNCLQYDVTVALIYEKVGKNPERITKTETFINKCNW